jgi:uncharacterized protein (DUF1778 family)
MKRRINIRLQARQAAALDEAAEARGVSRAELIRQFIDDGIGPEAVDLEADLAAIDASFGAMRDAGDFQSIARGPDDRSSHLRRSASRRPSRP